MKFLNTSNKKSKADKHIKYAEEMMKMLDHFKLDVDDIDITGNERIVVDMIQNFTRITGNLQINIMKSMPEEFWDDEIEKTFNDLKKSTQISLHSHQFNNAKYSSTIANKAMQRLMKKDFVSMGLFNIHQSFFNKQSTNPTETLKKLAQEYIKYNRILVEKVNEKAYPEMLKNVKN